MTNDIIIVGGFHEMIELAKQCGKNVIGIIDNRLEKEYFNIPILGKDSDAQDLSYIYGDVDVVIAPDKPNVRERLAGLYASLGFNFATLISPLAILSESASIGKGVVIQSYTNISSNTVIGSYVKINTMANVMHDCHVHEYTTIAPNAVLLGNVTVKKSSYIGANATILPNVAVGQKSIIGAASVITKDVKSNSVVKGNPGK